MRNLDNFDDHDFQLLEQLLEQDGATREQSLLLVDPSGRRAVFKEMIELAQTEDPLDRSAGEVFPELLRPNGFSQHGIQLGRSLDEGNDTAIVYRGTDLLTDQPVAVKVLTVPLAINPHAERRFKTETEALKKLDHPAIVPLLRSGTVDSLPFFVMPLIEGQSLRKYCQAAVQSGVGVNPAWCWKAAAWIKLLALAIDYAHQNGFIHRDVKPSNIVLDENQNPFLLDFGIAKVIGETTQTPENQGAGTPAYMSPEQLGVVDSPVTIQTDIYSLGLVLFECLTLTRPRRSSSREECLRECRERNDPHLDPHSVSSEVPDALAAVCRRALSLSPGGRYATAAEMATALDKAINGKLSTPPRTVVRLLRLARRYRAPLMAMTGVAIAAGVAYGAFWVTAQPRGTIEINAGLRTDIWLRLVDPGTRQPGPPVAIGTAPLATSLPPGMYRIEYVQSGSRFEHTRTVRNGRTCVASLHAGEAGARDEGMVYIEGGTAVVGNPMMSIAEAPSLAQRRVTVAPFWIDRYEVTNAEYREFVLATGRPSPPVWPTPYHEDWDLLPVVGVSADDAAAYAEWVGKRLPTDVEWEVAAAGLNAQPYPWSLSGGHTPDVLLDSQAERLSWAGLPTDLLARQAYLGHVRPAAEARGDLTPTGLVNMWGNVGEWTESVLAGPVPLSIAKGRTWADGNPSQATLQSLSLVPIGGRAIGIGFRCARSAD